MSFSNRSAQIAEIQKYLEWWLTENEEREEPLTTEALAIEIVNGYHNLLKSNLKKPITNLHPGMAFKVPWSTKVYFVSHVTQDGSVWVTAADHGFGWFGEESDPQWRYAEESRSKPKDNPIWKTGDKVSRLQRTHRYTVIATSERSVLLRETRTGKMLAESNDNLEKYYKREK